MPRAQINKIKKFYLLPLFINISINTHGIISSPCGEIGRHKGLKSNIG